MEIKDLQVVLFNTLGFQILKKVEIERTWNSNFLINFFRKYEYFQPFLNDTLFCSRSGDDEIHFKPRQLEADDEHAEGKVEEHPIRSLPRL